jgi:hypothetical protein
VNTGASPKRATPETTAEELGARGADALGDGRAAADADGAADGDAVTIDGGGAGAAGAGAAGSAEAEMAGAAAGGLASGATAAALAGATRLAASRGDATAGLGAAGESFDRPDLPDAEPEGAGPCAPSARATATPNKPPSAARHRPATPRCRTQTRDHTGKGEGDLTLIASFGHAERDCKLVRARPTFPTV